MAIKDKARLLKDLLALGVCFRHRLSEPDLQVYAELIHRNLDDREWQHAMAYFSGSWARTDEAPRFMPTPQELVAVGRRSAPAEAPLTDEQREFREVYFRGIPLHLLADDAVSRDEVRIGRSKIVGLMPEPPSEEEWQKRRAALLAQAEEGK